MDGKLVGKVLGYFSHPDERPGKVFVFPHLFAEVMDVYMKTHGVTEERPGRDRRAGVRATRSTTPTRRCATWSSRSRRPARSRASTATSSTGCRSRPTTARRSPTATRRSSSPPRRACARLGVAKKDCVRIAGWGQATDPLQKEGRDVLRPKGRVRRHERRPTRWPGSPPQDVNVAELHDCFTVMGAIGTEVIGKAEYGEGAQLLGGRQGGAGRRVRHQHVGRPHRQGPPDRRHRHRHDRLVRLAAPRQGARRAAGEEAPAPRPRSTSADRSARRSAPSSPRHPDMSLRGASSGRATRNPPSLSPWRTHA